VGKPGRPVQRGFVKIGDELADFGQIQQCGDMLGVITGYGKTE
jgi:hypothetical protein